MVIHTANHPEFPLTDIQEPILSIYALLIGNAPLSDYLQAIFIGSAEESFDNTIYLPPAMFITDSSLDMAIGMGDTFSNNLSVDITLILPVSFNSVSQQTETDEGSIPGDQMLASRIMTHVLKLIINNPILDSDDRQILDSIKALQTIPSNFLVTGEIRRTVRAIFDQLRIDHDLIFTGS